MLSVHLMNWSQDINIHVSVECKLAVNWKHSIVNRSPLQSTTFSWDPPWSKVARFGDKSQIWLLLKTNCDFLGGIATCYFFGYFSYRQNSTFLQNFWKFVWFLRNILGLSWTWLMTKKQNSFFVIVYWWNVVYLLVFGIEFLILKMFHGFRSRQSCSWNKTNQPRIDVCDVWDPQMINSWVWWWQTQQELRSCEGQFQVIQLHLQNHTWHHAHECYVWVFRLASFQCCSASWTILWCSSGEGSWSLPSLRPGCKYGVTHVWVSELFIHTFLSFRKGSPEWGVQALIYTWSWGSLQLQRRVGTNHVWSNWQSRILLEVDQLHKINSYLPSLFQLYL